MKLLSVAIPCYNSENYMRHCIESLLPGGDEVEILIVDDGSTKAVSYTHLDVYKRQIVVCAILLRANFMAGAGGNGGMYERKNRSSQRGEN